MLCSVTIVEKDKIDVEKKVVTITDKYRTVEKILSCENLEDFLVQGKQNPMVLQHISYISVFNVSQYVSTTFMCL